MQSKKRTNKFTKSKGSKNQYKSKEKRIAEDSKSEGKNDISWYGDPNFIAAAARLNFTNPLGKPIGYGFYSDPNGATTGPDSTSAVMTLPGIMSFGVGSTPGICRYASDAGNIFIRNFYSWIRHQNSGHANYDAPDLAMYVFEINEIHAMIEHLIRVYGVARTASSANRYMPDAELLAMGIAPDSHLYDNLADFRARLLALMVKAGTFVMPKDIKFNERYRTLFKYVYMDGESAKSSLYMFYPAYYRVYNELEAKLETKASPIGNTVYAWLSVLDEMINSMISSESMNIMSGDILKAYGNENIYRLEYFGEDYTVIPTYNSEILLQVHNAKIAGPLYDISAGDITQDRQSGILMCTPYFNQSVPNGEINPLIDMPIQDPTPDQVMIATRFANVGGVGYMTADNKWKYCPYALGSEFISNCRVFMIRNGDITISEISGGINTRTDNIRDKLLRYTNFDWHPHMYIISPNSDTNTIVFFGTDSQIENYTTVDSGTLDKIHEYALIGMFRVPLMGTWQTNFVK